MPYGNEHNFEGIYVATICPMHKDGSIDEEGLTDHFSNLINFEGIVGFLINGHASENHLLNRDEKGAVLILSLEMPGESLTTRMLSGMSRLNQQKVRSGMLKDNELKSLLQEGERLKNLPLWIDDSSLPVSYTHLTLPTICSV